MSVILQDTQEMPGLGRRLSEFPCMRRPRSSVFVSTDFSYRAAF